MEWSNYSSISSLSLKGYVPLFIVCKFGKSPLISVSNGKFNSVQRWRHDLEEVPKKFEYRVTPPLLFHE